MNNILCIIQARTGSTRLPNKVLLPFYNEESILKIICSRFLNKKLIVATTINPSDDKIELLCKKLKINVFRGEEENVLKRFINCAEYYNAKTIIRICSDNPFINYKLSEQLLNHHINSSADYTSYISSSGVPSIKTHYGLFTEIVELDALKKIQHLTEEKLYQEHVTNFIYEHPNQFKISYLQIPELIDKLKFRLTIDSETDWEILKKLYYECYNLDSALNIETIIKKIKDNPYILEIMNNQILKFSK
jgi:spore coat polysaccharide biosynthesis protein SpsF (cytidylyltransferase family)